MQTHHAMRALAGFDDLDVDFVAGADNPAWAQMQAMVASRPRWRLQSFVRNFHQLMFEADLFVGAGGGTSWERAAMGLPTVRSEERSGGRDGFSSCRYRWCTDKCKKKRII